MVSAFLVDVEIGGPLPRSSGYKAGDKGRVATSAWLP